MKTSADRKPTGRKAQTPRRKSLLAPEGKAVASTPSPAPEQVNAVSLARSQTVSPALPEAGFVLESAYVPQGDQPEAIDMLVENLRQGVRDQVNNYMRTVMQEEPVDPSLENLKDDKSW